MCELEHPMWERDVHPLDPAKWTLYATLNQRSEKVMLCFHCGQPFPCREALIRDVVGSLVGGG